MGWAKPGIADGSAEGDRVRIAVGKSARGQETRCGGEERREKDAEQLKRTSFFEAVARERWLLL